MLVVVVDAAVVVAGLVVNVKQLCMLINQGEEGRGVTVVHKIGQNRVAKTEIYKNSFTYNHTIQYNIYLIPSVPPGN